MHKIILDGFPFFYKIKRKSITSMRLKFHDHQTLEITAHRLVPQFHLEKFLVANRSWILKNQSKIPRYPKLETLKFVTILGKKLPMMPIPKLQSLAQVLITDHLEKLCLEYGFTYNRLSLKNQSTRFGSCSSKNNLNFNWQIIFFPPEIFRHLLLHELVHTKIKNHQLEFWNYLQQLDPQAKKHNRWLKEQGSHHFLLKP